MVYLVEDDENIRELVTYTLNSQGIETESFERPSKFWKAMQQEIPSLFLLDIMLPEEDGLSILKKIKNTSQTKKLPVIMLTAKGSEYDTVLGLDSGADDYIAKPFRMMELISRVRAALRRSDPKEQDENLADSRIFIACYPPGKYGLESQAERLGKKALYLPGSFDYDEIIMQWIPSLFLPLSQMCLSTLQRTFLYSLFQILQFDSSLLITSNLFSHFICFLILLVPYTGSLFFPARKHCNSLL